MSCLELPCAFTLGNYSFGYQLVGISLFRHRPFVRGGKAFGNQPFDAGIQNFSVARLFRLFRRLLLGLVLFPEEGEVDISFGVVLQVFQQAGSIGCRGTQVVVESRIVQ